MSRRPRARPVEVLLAEDNDDDMELTRLAFEAAAHPIRLHHVTDGEQCLAFLRRQEPYSAAPEPDLLLLDINMPRLDGRGVLEELNRDPALRRLPVVVLTSSDAASDVRAAYDLRCSSYFVKPLDFNRFAAEIRVLADYWFSLVVLPTDAQR